MNYYLIHFKAKYYCQGFEYAWYDRLVKADTYEAACEKLRTQTSRDWEYLSPTEFENYTIE